MVEKPAGFMFVPSAQVRFEAADLPGAYLKLADSIREQTPQTHLAVATWCVSNKLYKEARAELMSALEMQPNREDCRQMLQRVELLIQKPRVQTSRSKLVEKKRDDWQPPAESLAGLSRQAAQKFTTRIHPILQNKCGTAACHGNHRTNRSMASQSGFSLSRSTRNHRTVAERNLAIAMKYIDTAVPTNSLLLKATHAGHGGGKRNEFVGRAGNKQLQMLRDWVFNVAAEKTVLERGNRSQKLLAAQFKTNELSKDRQVTPVDGQRFQSRNKRDSNPHLHEVTPVRKAADPFDPAEFNQQNQSKSSRR